MYTDAEDVHIGCKSSCIDFLKHNIDVTRCVDCFNCINTCPDKAISYGLVSSKNKEHETDESKRKFIAGSLYVICLVFRRFARGQEKSAPVPKKESTVKENKNIPCLSSGAGSIEDFKNDCTACSLCITACPNDVLQACC